MNAVKPPQTIEGRGLTRRFGGFTAVNDVSVTLSGAGVTALIGPNGAGKTTLFNLISGQTTPDAGVLLIDGVEVTGSPAYTMAKLGIGRSFQDVRLFDGMSVRENVAVYAQQKSAASILWTCTHALGQRRIHREAFETADAMLEYLKISHLRDSHAGALGFAEQKLVAIARLLALRPRTLLLDEPASGLDHTGRKTLSSTIEQLAADGYFVCFVEHNTHLVRQLAERVLFLSEGRILADGPPDAIFSDSRLAEAYLGLA